MSGLARYTVKFVAAERQGSLLVLLSPSQPCSALCDAVRKRRNDLNLDGVEATLHLEDADGPELYPADSLSDILPGAKETVVVVFQVSTRSCSLSRQPASSTPGRSLRRPSNTSFSRIQHESS
jgi:hypothetical protein